MDEGWFLSSALNFSEHFNFNNPMILQTNYPIFKDGIIISSIFIRIFDNIFVGMRFYGLCWFALSVILIYKISYKFSSDWKTAVLSVYMLVFFVCQFDILIFRPEIVLIGIFLSAAYCYFVKGNIYAAIFISILGMIAHMNAIIFILCLIILSIISIYRGNLSVNYSRAIKYITSAIIIVASIYVMPDFHGFVKDFSETINDVHHNQSILQELTRYEKFLAKQISFVNIFPKTNMRILFLIISGLYLLQFNKLRHHKALNESFLIFLIMAGLTAFIIKNRTSTYIAMFFPIFAFWFAIILSNITPSKYANIIIVILISITLLTANTDKIRFNYIIHRKENSLYRKLMPYSQAKIFGYTKLILMTKRNNVLSYHALLYKKDITPYRNNILQCKYIIYDPFLKYLITNGSISKDILRIIKNYYKPIAKIKTDSWSLKGEIIIFHRIRKNNVYNIRD